MIGELDIFGVFVPMILLWIAVAFAISVLVRRVLRRTGAYRLVWHRPLFDFAVFVILLGGVAMLSHTLGIAGPSLPWIGL